MNLKCNGVQPKYECVELHITQNDLLRMVRGLNVKSDYSYASAETVAFDFDCGTGGGVVLKLKMTVREE